MSPAMLGFVAFGLTLFSLYFINGLLTDCVDTVYMCYAHDRDQARVTQPEVHAIYEDLPSNKKGAVVQNPDGTIKYGSASTTQARASPYSSTQRARP